MKKIHREKGKPCGSCVGKLSANNGTAPFLKASKAPEPLSFALAIINQ